MRHSPLTTILLTAALTGIGISSALAAPSWSGERTLTCADGQVLHTALPPSGFGAPFHLLEGTAVFVPRVVTVNGSFVTKDEPGAARDAVEELTCSYTDPAGLDVEVVGHLTGR